MSTDPWTTVTAAREGWRQADREVPRLRYVHGALADLHDAVARNRPDRADPDAVTGSLARLGGESDDRRAALGFLTDPLFEGDATLAEAFRQGRALAPGADAVASALAAYVEGGDWTAVRDAMTDIVAPPGGPAAIDTTALAQARTLFELAVEAAIAARETRADDLSTALVDAYESSTQEVLADLDEQPVALLPVRLETRFVDENRGTEGDLAELLVRVYPDQIHADSHEEGLTDDEIRWGQNFWATLWYARHPDPTVVPDAPSASYLQERLPSQRLREFVADIDASAFSAVHYDRYSELKERAWRQLLDRFGRERAAYIVHALKPDDGDDLLTRPAPPPEYEFVPPDPVTVGTALELANLEPVLDTTESGPLNLTREPAVDRSRQSTDLPREPAVDFDAAEQTIDTDTQNPERRSDGGDESEPPDLPKKVPALGFPTVPRRPESWTQPPRASLLPDRWVAVAEWSDDQDRTRRTAVAGNPVREPLPVGPSPESVAGEDLAGEASDSPAPDGTEWMIDFDEAEAVGMGLRVNLAGLSGFDPGEGFDRLVVVGVKASMDATETPAALSDLLDAHHYTDGLELLENGTPTNNHGEASGYSSDDPLESMAVECVPPLVEAGDRSDGDLLARALALDAGVFANVANADATGQRDARHVNSALWPATLGYFFQDLLIHNRVTDNDSLWGGPLDRPRNRRAALGGPMLLHDAYRRHFVRYVRARGPFPALRTGTQPYGILPAKPVETDLDVTIVDQTLVADLQQGKIGLAEAEQRGASAADLANAGVDPQTLLDAGADPEELLEAGADPRRVVAGTLDPTKAVDARDLAPEALLGDGIGLRATSQVTRKRLREAGVPVNDLEVTVQDIARGNVTDAQLAEAGVTTEAVAEVLLPERARSLGITPAALERAGVTPAALLRREISAEQVEALGLSTRTVAEAVLPREVRELGITPKKLEDAGIGPQDLLNGTVSAADLERAGVTTEALAEALLPAELRAAGVTPEVLAEAVTVEELFDGTVGFDDLAEAGLTTERLAEAVLPQSFRDAGITPDALERAGITPDAVLNGQVTPEDIIEAGITPESLAEAGLLPDALADIGHAVGDLLDAGLAPRELLDGGLSVESLLDAGIDPGLLVETGIAPEKLVDAGVDAFELATSGAPLKRLTSVVSASDLARVGATVEDLTGGDVPAADIVTAGFSAVEALQAGADALGIAQGGARPSELRAAGVDAGTLRGAGEAAGSLRLAGYSADELLDAGYTAGELLNGGFSRDALQQAGINPETVAGAGRRVGDLLAAGYPLEELRKSGYDAAQLREAGMAPDQLAAAGYTAGELRDAGLSTEALAGAGVDAGQLRAAGASVEELAAGGADPESLKNAGASAEELLAGGFDPQDLLDAGFASVELELAGVDVDALAEDVLTGETGVEGVADATIKGLQYAATVFEDPTQAAADLYSFSFDPAVPNVDGPARKRAGERDSERPAGQPDGGVAGGVPVVRPLAVDDRVPADLEARLAGVSERWDEAAQDLPFAGSTDESALVNALKREGVSADLRQQTMAYSGERIGHSDPLNSLVRANFAPGSQYRQFVRDLSRAGDLDPRHGHFHTTDIDREQLDERRRGRQVPRALAELYTFHDNFPKAGTIAGSEIVDGDIDAFVDVLLDSTLSEVVTLSRRIEPGALSLDSDTLEGNWRSLDTGGKRRRIVTGIESADDPEGFAQRLLGSSATDAPGHGKIRRLASNQATHGDSGALRSVLRLLLQHGLLQEYVAARRRLGLAYDDLPEGWPDPAYYDEDTTGPLAPVLDDPVPNALRAHPNVGGTVAGGQSVIDDSALDASLSDSNLDLSRDRTDGGGRYVAGRAGRYGLSGTPQTVTYADALQSAAADYTASTSIDARLSEFTDSLAHLRDVEPASLSRLTREALDLASHRLDAWWTSLATKRLFELREAQGTYDGDAGLDHETWGGGGGDAPRATLDPGLLSAVSPETLQMPALDIGEQSEGDESAGGAGGASDSGGASDESADAGDSGTATAGSGALGAYDPAAIADMDRSLGADDDARSEDDTRSDGGTGPPAGDAGEGGAGDLLGNAATRGDLSDPEAVSDRVAAEPGLYVGGYGFVENLAADAGEREPEYIHAPSEQHATTAAILRSGAQAHDADEGENPMRVDLSAARVREGLRLIRGVRRGQSPGELLGYRFERRLHEETVSRGPSINLMAHLDAFRAAFPATHGKIERPDEQSDASKSARADAMAARDALDGYRLVKRWDQYPFGRTDLPDDDGAEYAILDAIVADLRESIDAAGDLLTAESIHQLGQGNFERAGGSVGALARGEPLPDPQVAQTPRSETGLTHRGCLLFGTPTVEGDSPRSAAEPALAAWVEGLLPAHEAVECLATYRWTETTTDPVTEQTVESEQTEATSATLADLDLGPLDVLLLFGADREETRSELEQRLVYRLLRDRPETVPADATVELRLTETETESATSMADLLELARSIREVVQGARPVDAEDLAHPTDSRGEGYDEQTVTTLRARADDAHDQLLAVAREVDDRLAVLDADHASALADVPTPQTASTDGGQTASGDAVTSATGIPTDTAPAADPLAVADPTVTEQATALAETAREAADAVPLDAVESVAESVNGASVRAELSTLVAELPPGIADPERVTADVTVNAEVGQSVGGTLGEPVAVPDVPDEDDGGTGGDGGGGGDGDSDTPDLVMPELDVEPQVRRSALGTTETDPMIETTVPLDSRSEIQRPDTQWYVEEANLTLPDLSDPQGGDGQDSDGGTGDDQQSGPDWSTKTATVRVWGTDGLSWFEREATTTPDADGSFAVPFDFDDIAPGTPFQLIAEVEGTVAYSATGRVVAEDATTDAQSTLDTCETLTQLCWLTKERDSLSVASGLSARLARALDRTNWAGVAAERDAADPASSTVTAGDIDAVDTLLALDVLDPGALAGHADATTAPVHRLGLDTVVDVTGDGTPGDASYWFGAGPGVGDVRARVTRMLENPALFEAGAPGRLLAYRHEAAATLHAMSDGETVAASLDAFLAQPPWVVRYLDRRVAEPGEIVRNLTAWLYSPDAADRPTPGELATSLRTLADSVADLPALAALFEGLPAGDGLRLGTFESHLRALADALDAGSPAVGDAATATSAFDTAQDDSASALASAAATARTALAPVPEGAEASFRTIVLERLREPMMVAASYGVYGGTPESAVGGTPADERRLREQAGALLGRLRERLTDAAALDPRIEATLADRPVPQRVEDQADRLAALFGDGFTVLPPFTPTNPDEVTATFTDDGLVGSGMAAEAWLQRAAEFREGLAEFREARAYAEAVTGDLTPSLTVGQVPFEPGDTWVGVEDVEPDSGKLSVVAQFGPDATPGTAGERLTGLFVDEWTQGVPEETERTGIALEYDDPGTRAPQSILVATPPAEGAWSLDHLVATVTETAEYAKRRAVDLGDLPDAARLFPGLYFALQADPEPATPTVDFRMLDWYDRTPVFDLVSPGELTLDMNLHLDDGGGS
jgi:hypothetical protein